MSENKQTHVCDFCGKNQHEVKNIVAGPKVDICDECVKVAHEIVTKADIGTPPDKTALDWFREVEQGKADLAPQTLSDDEAIEIKRALLAAAGQAHPECGGFAGLANDLIAAFAAVDAATEQAPSATRSAA